MDCLRTFCLPCFKPGGHTPSNGVYPKHEDPWIHIRTQRVLNRSICLSSSIIIMLCFLAAWVPSSSLFGPKCFAEITWIAVRNVGFPISQTFWTIQNLARFQRQNIKAGISRFHLKPEGGRDANKQKQPNNNHHYPHRLLLHILARIFYHHRINLLLITFRLSLLLESVIEITLLLECFICNNHHLVSGLFGRYFGN